MKSIRVQISIAIFLTAVGFSLLYSLRKQHGVEDRPGVESLRPVKRADDAPPSQTAAKTGEKSAVANNQKTSRSAAQFSGNLLDLKYLRDPEYLKNLKVILRKEVDFRYARLFKSLSLDREANEKLRQLLVDKRIATAQGPLIADEMGIDPSSKIGGAEYNRIMLQVKDGFNARIGAVIGEAALPEYKAYEWSIPLRTQLDTYEHSLSGVSNPLTDAQYNQVLATLLATPNPTTELLPPGLGDYQIPDSSVDKILAVLDTDQQQIFLGFKKQLDDKIEKARVKRETKKSRGY